MKHKNNKTKNKFKYKPKRGGGDNPQYVTQYAAPQSNYPTNTQYKLLYPKQPQAKLPSQIPVASQLPQPQKATPIASPTAGGGEKEPPPTIKLKSNMPLVAKISSFITIMSGMSFLIFLLVWYMLFTILFTLINNIIKVINKAIGSIIKAFSPGSKAKPPKIPLGPKNLFDLLLNNVGPLPAIY